MYNSPFFWKMLFTLVPANNPCTPCKIFDMLPSDMKTLMRNTFALITGVFLALSAVLFAYGQGGGISQKQFVVQLEQCDSLEQTQGIPTSGIYVSQATFLQCLNRIQQVVSSGGFPYRNMSRPATGGAVLFLGIICNLEPGLSSSGFHGSSRDYFIYTLERMLC